MTPKQFQWYPDLYSETNAEARRDETCAHTIQFTLQLLASADAGMVLSAHVGLRN